MTIAFLAIHLGHFTALQIHHTLPTPRKLEKAHVFGSVLEKLAMLAIRLGHPALLNPVFRSIAP